MMTQREAKIAGRAAGKALASWVFDGNTTDETYRAFLTGYDDGDPKIMDQFAPRSGWLSGEMAGESMNEILGEPLDARDEERRDAVAALYEEYADKAYWAELVKTAKRALR